MSRLSVAYANAPFHLLRGQSRMVITAVAAIFLLMIARNVIFNDYRQAIRGELTISGLAPELVERYAPKTSWERSKDAVDRKQELLVMKNDINSLLAQVNELNRIIRHHKLDVGTPTEANSSQQGSRTISS